MDKNAIKKFAVQARIDLIESVGRRAKKYGIEKEHTVDANADSVNGKVLSDTEKKQRKALIAKIGAEGYEQVMEEMAYTWFNRFCALRFMEVNEYLPSRVRVFTDADNNFKPQILAEAIHLDLDGLDMGKVYELKESNNQEDLYRYLLITQCNALSKVLPGMFQKIEDYTELCLPDFLLREGSIIDHMIAEIKPEEWKDQIQIIGWLYQYYNTEKKDEVFAALKKNIKITKENISAATQLFTPDWIVRYMVENSLGRLWVEGHPDSAIRSEWKYYLDEAEQEAEVQVQLDEIRKEYAEIKPEEIRCIDPCAGSGHICAYLFDVLMQIYQDYGYNARDSVRSIIENNLYGLDIDERAAQLAYFSVMMKAVQYDTRFLRRNDIPQPHVYAVQESNHLDNYALDYFINGDSILKEAMDCIINSMYDAKEYGSLVLVQEINFCALYTRFKEIADDISISKAYCLDVLLPLVQITEVLANKYNVVVTNPPYMAVSNASSKVIEFIKKEYPDSKADFFAVFIERCQKMLSKNGYQAMITQHAWMFLSSFEKLRIKISNIDIINMLHLGARAFDEIGGEVVQTTSFVLRESRLSDYKASYCRLVDANSEVAKKKLFLSGDNRFVAKQKDFSNVPGTPIAYWVSEKVFKFYETELTVGNVSEGKVGCQTGNNNIFLRLWYELVFGDISFDANSDYKWFPYNKGGGYRRWYGNNEYVINWSNDGYEIKHFKGAFPRNTQYYFREGMTWSDVATGLISMRYMPSGYAFDTCAPCLFVNDEFYNLLGLFNTPVAQLFMDLMSPTMHYTCGSLVNVPYIKTDINVETFVTECIEYAKTDWDSFESSWDFQHHPFVYYSKGLWDVTAVAASLNYFYGGHPQINSPIEACYMLWQGECQERFNKLKANEEKLNRIFIDIYGLQDELTPEVEDKDVTVRLADKSRDVRSFISYAVGCMFGRYSLDIDGLILAGQPFNSRFAQNPMGYMWGDPAQLEGNYISRTENGKDYISCSFFPDIDNIIPICDDEYFTDDIVNRFVDFVRVVYGEETLEENLKFIADALGGSGTARQAIRNYFINDFYNDHCKIYQKRPIYWLFDSGKKNGFKCLIYMHRYQSDTIARIRTDYVHEQQSRYRTAIADLEGRILSAATSERVRLNKQLSKLQAQSEELRVYEEKIHHLADQYITIDLDDGVKVNYAKFQDVLAKIK